MIPKSQDFSREIPIYITENENLPAGRQVENS